MAKVDRNFEILRTIHSYMLRSYSYGVNDHVIFLLVMILNLFYIILFNTTRFTSLFCLKAFIRLSLFINIKIQILLVKKLKN